MSSRNWNPRVGRVSLTFEYYVDLDDEEMVESAKESCLQDAMETEFTEDYRVDVTEMRTNPDYYKDLICDCFMETRVERLLDQNKCPYCKKPLQRINRQELHCEVCNEDWEWHP